jgi:hypothetical protein
MTKAELDMLAPAIARAVAEALRPHVERIHELEQVLAKQPQLKYCGVYAPERTYALGNFVTHKGSVWHCNAPESDHAPGEQPDRGHWTLAVKRGPRARQEQA